MTGLFVNLTARSLHDDAAQEEPRGTRQRLAVLFGHSKDHRPDLKQLLYILTVTEDGGVPVYFTTANDADIRMMAPRERKPEPEAAERTTTVATEVRASHRLLPGTVVTREYKGRTVRVHVLDDGFECEGERYKSLTAVAEAVTGKHWNGHHFFHLRRNGGER